MELNFKSGQEEWGGGVEEGGLRSANRQLSGTMALQQPTPWLGPDIGDVALPFVLPCCNLLRVFFVSLAPAQPTHSTSMSPRVQHLGHVQSCASPSCKTIQTTKTLQNRLNKPVSQHQLVSAKVVWQLAHEWSSPLLCTLPSFTRKKGSPMFAAFPPREVPNCSTPASAGISS